MKHTAISLLQLIKGFMGNPDTTFISRPLARENMTPISPPHETSTAFLYIGFSLNRGKPLIRGKSLAPFLLSVF